jgi:actin related protein 2/3 complex subunit 4
LDISLCLRDFPSTLFEKDNKPYIELTGYNNNNKIDTLISKPIYLARSKKEQFLIEPSINSCRVQL